MASSGSASADFCDHTPSKIIGGKKRFAAWSAASTGEWCATAAAGAGFEAAGNCMRSHAATGATMRGPIAGEASVASTVGIIGGTAGTLGTVAGALMSPLVISRLQSWLPASPPKRVDAMWLLDDSRAADRP